ncbi:MAG: biotin--[acetyl-CoA-carboxylase] ligase [Armatimonadota bacterium]
MQPTDVPPARPGAPLVRVGELGSTNDLARLMADAGLPERTVVVARCQTQGRGRHSRTWISPPGGLWCSIVLRPARDAGWGRLSLAMAVAAAEAIDEVAGVQSAIRWPNDIVIGGRKVAGVLLEGARGAIVVGIGINANVPAEALPQALRTAAVSLHDVTGRPMLLDPLLETLLARADAWYAAWAQGGPQVLDAWAARDATRGHRIVANSLGISIEGIADGADPDGALRVRLPGGEVRRVVVSDVAVIPHAGARQSRGQEPVE